MSYTPPARDAVDFDLASGYSVPAGDAVDFGLAADNAAIGTLQGTTEAASSAISASHIQPRDLVIDATTESASGTVAAVRGVVAQLAGDTDATGQVQTVHGVAGSLQATTESPTPALVLKFTNTRLITIDSATEAASGTVQAVRGVAVTISATTDSIGQAATVEWGVELPRAGLNSSVGGQAAPWSAGQAVDNGPALGHNDAPVKQRDNQSPWRDAAHADKAPAMPFSVIPARYADTAASWDAFASRPDPAPLLDYLHPGTKQPEKLHPWGDFDARPDLFAGMDYSQPPPKERFELLPYFHVDPWTPTPIWNTATYTPPDGKAVNFDLGGGYYTGPAGDKVMIPWGGPYPYGDQPSRPKDQGPRIAHNVPSPVQEDRTVPWGDGSWTRPLPDYEIGPGWNVDPDEPATPPPMPVISEVYIFMPNITLYRIPDGAEVEALAVTWSTDADSWGWRFNATLKKESDLALLKPDSNGPREIGCIINGHEFKGIVEGFGTSRQFGQSGYTIKGRSLSAYLSDPYAPLRSKAIDAQYSARQLAEQELLNTGWTLNWQVTDWVVPGGAFSYQERDAIAVVKQIAEAIGGTVQTDPSLQQLHIKPRYPVSPHLWDNVGTQLDAILPAELIKTIGSEYRRLPAYNRSFVAGGPTGGVIVMVTRDGTAGDIQMPQIVDPLVTHTDAGYERARNEIAKGGNWETLQLETWLTQQGQAPGLLLPGHLVEIQDVSETYRSLISGTTINATSTPQALIVRQQLTAERFNG